MEAMLPSSVLLFISQYGEFAVFLLLALGIVGLPIPDESLLLFTGYLIAKGALSFWLTPIVVYAGSMLGITVSYSLGVFGGRPLALRYGGWIHLTEAKLKKTEHWFSKIGKWLLIVGYFLPGIRHLAGFVVGTVKLPYPTFALFAYTGAILWASTFLLIGYLA
jgi:membrane protein DedA with SNARE-associated domain